MADHVEIVGDEDVGQPEFVLEVGEEIEDLRLHGDVERRHRLVADDELGPQCERTGDADPLTLSARELVRQPVVVLGVETDEARSDVTRSRISSFEPNPYIFERLRNDAPDMHPRVEGSEWVLEDHHQVSPDRDIALR